MKLKIAAFSTALFSTWINVENLDLLIDAGDGLTSSLLQKSRKIKYIFITHPDRDHLTGLLQMNQLNAREGFPKIYYPKDSGSFPALQKFQNQFDPHIKSIEWTGIEAGSTVEIKNNFYVEALRNEHITTEKDFFKSLSYKVFETKQKLKLEFHNFSPEQIKEISLTKGSNYITNTVKNNIISFSGDTPVDDYSKWDNSEILCHESTFLTDVALDAMAARPNRHSRIDEVFKMVSEINIGKLILHHFSTRYSIEQIDAAAKQMCKTYGIKIPVHIIYPGQVHYNVLKDEPIN